MIDKRAIARTTTDPEVLRGLAGDEDWSVRQWIASREDLPAEIVAKLDWEVRRLIRRCK